ncbi:ASCH domain-containing protein [Lacunimicrobium album]
MKRPAEQHVQSETDLNQLALGVKHPWAELILRGFKTLEIRSQPTNVRGRIYIYSSRRPATEEFARRAVSKFEVKLDELSYGLLVGDVELVDCRPCTPEDTVASCVPEELLIGKYSWVLANPRMFADPLTVRFLPYGVWFYPFRRRGDM